MAVIGRSIPGSDFIQMPHRHSFVDEDGLVATIAHETGHWTGIPAGLPAPSENDWRQGYAFEELVAEQISARICYELGLPPIARKPCQLYRPLVILKSDKSAIITAAAKADQAFNHPQRSPDTTAKLRRRAMKRTLQATLEPGLKAIVRLAQLHQYATDLFDASAIDRTGAQGADAAELPGQRTPRRTRQPSGRRSRRMEPFRTRGRQTAGGLHRGFRRRLFRHRSDPRAGRTRGISQADRLRAAARKYAHGDI